jgi:chaperonin GroES
MALNIKPFRQSSYRTSCLQKQNCLRIFIPDTAKETTQKELCARKWNKEHTMTKKLWLVLYGKYAGTELKLEGKII